MYLKASNARTRLGLFFMTGALVFTSVLLIFIFSNGIIRVILQKKLTLKPGNEFYDIWKELPIPIYQKIYVFNITNPIEFTENGSKAILQELGPYVFRGHWKKEEMSWNDQDGTITYKDVKEYVFEPELSVGDQEEMIYTLNGPLLAVINYVEDYAPFFLRSIVVEVMNGIFESYNETLLVHKSIREIVYEGYHEPMVADLTKVVEPFINLPLKLVNDTFGILYERKHVGDGVFTIKSGANDIADYSSIQKWNNKTSVDWWNDKYCNQINGTDGVQYAPGITREQTLNLFNPNLCRTLPLQYERDITVHGIQTFRFGLPPTTLSSGEVYPENKCYCSGYNCHISGILPLSCKKGAPYVISFPHFLEGDPELQSAIEGVQASEDKHKSYLDIEPNTGFVLNAAFRIQLNSVIRKLQDYKALQNVEESIVPVLWMSEEAQLDVFFANYFKRRVQTPLLIFKGLCIAGIAVGALWVFCSIIIYICVITKVKTDKFKPSVVMRTLNSAYTTVSLWPPMEDGIKDSHITEKTHL